MISLAGGQNAYTGSIPFPAVSYESVISMNPQIIIDIVSIEQNQPDPQTIKEQWKYFSLVDAVKNDRIYVFTENYTAIPGPRFVLTLEKIAQAINPDIGFKENERKGN
jgi:iron complex transport system substrate-binding protein